ncbi:MAG: U32 family peptidase [Rikenellaceae bacterium]
MKSDKIDNIRELELLAPARNLEGACTAIDHGADAVYIGAASFGARANSTNNIADIAKAVEYAHKFGAKLYVALNTLLFDGELARAEKLARELVAVGVDALIVQDMAYAKMNLGTELHASTQTTNVEAKKIDFLGKSGFSRVVLERNLSLDQIRKISRTTDVELEAFVHGAVCIGHSGACYLSKAINGGARSGNRGDCSQSCRLSFDLLDQYDNKIVEGKHLLSAKDLNLSQRLGELVDAGVTSFKIEGRLKELNYTRNIVAYYRQELDKIIARRSDLRRSSDGVSTLEFEPNPAKSFSRSESIFLFDGQTSGVVSLDTPKSLGERVGRVVAIKRDKFCVEQIMNKSGNITSLANGDGICYVSTADEKLVGSNVNRIEVDSEHQRWYKLNKMSGMEVGTVIYRNHNRLFESAVEGSRTRRRVAVRCAVHSTAEMFEVTFSDERGNSATAGFDGAFEASKSREKMEDVLRTQLAKCGETIFEICDSNSDIDCTGWNGEFIAAKMLAELRRDALAELEQKRIAAANVRAKRIFEENVVPYPATTVEASTGVTNELAETFYRERGVRRIEPSLELMDRFESEKDGGSKCKVMTTNYCIRREIGACIKHGDRRIKGDLFLQRGAQRFLLEFDCGRCQMSLVKA